MAMALLARRWTGCRTIFDIRGLLAEEYADAGIWPDGSLPFRAVKWIERTGARKADRVVVLTDRMRDWLVSEGLVTRDRVEVIPCCVDFQRFGASGRSGMSDMSDMSGMSDLAHRGRRFELVYAGAVSGLYLLDEMARFFLAVRELRGDAFLRILTPGDAPATARRLEALGVASSLFAIHSVRPEEVPDYLRAARAGLSFRKPTFSQIAASPTKIPEYLAAGIPVVCSGGVGDTDRLVTDEGVGVVLPGFAAAAHSAAAAQLLALCAEPDLHNRCLRAAETHFDLARVGGPRYRRVYEQLQQPLSVG